MVTLELWQERHLVTDEEFQARSKARNTLMSLQDDMSDSVQQPVSPPTPPAPVVTDPNSNPFPDLPVPTLKERPLS